MAPKIVTATRRVKVKAGFPLNFEVDFVGEPNPKVEWSFIKGTVQPMPESLIVDSKGKLTNIYFPAAKR